MFATVIAQWPRIKHVTKLCLWMTAAAVIMPSQLPFRWNDSASVPIGVYWISNEAPKVGSLIEFCLPEVVGRYAKARGYIGFGVTCPGWTQALLKPVAAVAGDTITVAPEGVTVRDVAVTNTEVFQTDSQGREHAFTVQRGMQHVPPGMVFVLSNYHPRSWDSRYFGCISLDDIRSTMEPVWTW